MEAETWTTGQQTFNEPHCLLPFAKEWGICRHDSVSNSKIPQKSYVALPHTRMGLGPQFPNLHFLLGTLTPLVLHITPSVFSLCCSCLVSTCNRAIRTRRK
ncbi:hypothetical protein V6N13_134456 [Hibiscus sabdariffa]